MTNKIEIISKKLDICVVFTMYKIVSYGYCLLILMKCGCTIMNPIKVAVVEQNEIKRNGLIQLINGSSGLICVGGFEDPSIVINRPSKIIPDVVIMDIELTGKLDGFNATTQIIQKLPKIHIIAHTSIADKTKILKAIKSGVSGYLLKKSQPSKLIEAIHEVILGGFPMCKIVSNKIVEILRSDYNLNEIQGRTKLTNRQKQILNCILEGKSYKIISDEMFISINTVKFHVKNIYGTFGVISRYELVAKLLK